MRNRLFRFVILALLFASPAAAQVTINYTFTAGTIIDPDQMNDNFSQLSTKALNRTGGTVTGVLTSTGGSMAGTWTVTGPLASSGGSVTGTWTGAPTMSGAWTFSGTPTMSGTTTYSGTLTSSGGTMSGSWAGTPTFSGTPTVSGTLTSSGGTISGTWAGAPTMSGAWVFSGAPSFNGNVTFGDAAADTLTMNGAFANTSLRVFDTNASHAIVIKPGSDITAERILTLTTGDAARTVTINGSPTLDDWFDQSVKTTATPTFGATTVTGALTISGASAGQVVFPASQNASAGANTLDDYEEGTWTVSPNTNLTLTSATGYYVKIGKLVHFQFAVTVNTVSGTDVVTLSLPFTSANPSAAANLVASTSGVDTGDVGLVAIISANVSSMSFNRLNDNAAAGSVGNDLLLAADTIAVTGTYIAAN